MSRYTKHITLSGEALAKARAVLEAEGYEVHTAPPVMLEAGVVLAAHRTADGEGYLLTAEELRLVAYYGLAALDRDHPDPRPRWERDTTANREAAYVEAALARALAEVASAPPGNRNNVLSRVAFGLGQLEHLGLDRIRALEALEQAALQTGLSLTEARVTIKRSFGKGAEHPRDLGQSPPFSAQAFALNKRDGEGQKRFVANGAQYGGVFARRGGRR